MARDAYTYLHVLFVAGIIVSAVGDELVIAHPTERAARRRGRGRRRRPGDLPPRARAVPPAADRHGELAAARRRRRLRRSPALVAAVVAALVVGVLVLAVLVAVIVSEHLAAARRARARRAVAARPARGDARLGPVAGPVSARGSARRPTTTHTPVTGSSPVLRSRCGVVESNEIESPGPRTRVSKPTVTSSRPDMTSPYSRPAWRMKLSSGLDEPPAS